jgi:hypothetical protein
MHDEKIKLMQGFDLWIESGRRDHTPVDKSTDIEGMNCGNRNGGFFVFGEEKVKDEARAVEGQWPRSSRASRGSGDEARA